MHSRKYHQNQDTEQLHHPQKSLLASSSSFPHRIPCHWQPLIYVFLCLLFPECHVNGVREDAVSLLSLAYFMWQDAVEIHPCVGSSFSLLSSTPFHCAGLPQFIHSPAE